MRSLLQQKQPALDLTADAIATILSDQRMEEIIERAQTAVEPEHTNTRTELEDGVGTNPGTLEVAHMLNLALMQFKRKKILAQLARAGLLCFRRYQGSKLGKWRCRARGTAGDYPSSRTRACGRLV